MGWSIGYDSNWDRDIGYGVPAFCDYPKCHTKIDRGLSYVCGGEPYGGDQGCGLYFCSKHLYLVGHGRNNPVQMCQRCSRYQTPYKRIKPDHPVWIKHKLTHESWEEWRKKNPEKVKQMGNEVRR